MTRKIFVNVKPYRSIAKITYVGKNLYSADEYDAELVSAPVDGKCNAELIKLLSEYFNISRSQIKIVGGFKSRSKIIELSSLD